MPGKRRIAGIVAGTLVVAAVAGIAYAVATPEAVEVEVAKVTTSDLAVTVSASGRVEAETSVDVYPPTTGTLAELLVADGDEVTAGQVLAVMDTAPIEVQVAQAEAAYRAAVAQRNAITGSAPGSTDLRAAQAAVDAAWSAYSVANAAYEAARAGVGAPTASDIAQAEAAVAVAASAAEAARSAYDAYYTTVYLPAPLPRDATIESTLAALALARGQADAALIDAQRGLAALLAASDNSAAVASARLARDQTYAAYLAAVSQKDALAKASNVGTALASADAAVEAAFSALEFANRTLDRAEIVAPAGGVVLFASSSAASLIPGVGAAQASGGSLAVGSSVTPASAPFTIVSFETLAFAAQVDETDVVRLEPGMPAVITLDGVMGREFIAELERIGKEAAPTATGGTAFPVRLRFAAGDAPVLLGMNGSVEIEVETIGSATTIPVEALLEEGDASYVYVVDGGVVSRVEIEAGRMTDTRVEVLDGLAEGDEVVVSGVGSLSDGARVRTKPSR